MKKKLEGENGKIEGRLFCYFFPHSSSSIIWIYKRICVLLSITDGMDVDRYEKQRKHPQTVGMKRNIVNQEPDTS